MLVLNGVKYPAFQWLCMDILEFSMMFTNVDAVEEAARMDKGVLLKVMEGVRRMARLELVGRPLSDDLQMCVLTSLNARLMMADDWMRHNTEWRQRCGDEEEGHKWRFCSCYYLLSFALTLHRMALGFVDEEYSPQEFITTFFSHSSRLSQLNWLEWVSATSGQPDEKDVQAFTESANNWMSERARFIETLYNGSGARGLDLLWCGASPIEVPEFCRLWRETPEGSAPAFSA